MRKFRKPFGRTRPKRRPSDSALSLGLTKARHDESRNRPVSTVEELSKALGKDPHPAIGKAQGPKEHSPPEAQGAEAVRKFPTAAGRQADVPMSPEEHLVSLVEPGSFEAEQFMRLRHAVEQMREDTGLRVFAVTSPSAGDGKSFVSSNLAGALAQNPETRVLLVDADLRKPSLHTVLGVDPGRHRGLSQFVHDTRLSLSDVVLTNKQFNLAVLPAGPPADSTYELFKSGRFKTLLEEARTLYDFVVVDTPPVLVVPDCRLLESNVDGFIMVVSANKTLRKLVEDAVGELSTEKMLGIVFNQYQHPSRYYSSYYSSYYTRVAKHKSKS